MIVTLFFTVKNILEHYALVAVFTPPFPESTLWFCKMDKKNVQNPKIFFQFGTIKYRSSEKGIIYIIFNLKKNITRCYSRIIC